MSVVLDGFTVSSQKHLKGTLAIILVSFVYGGPVPSLRLYQRVDDKTYTEVNIKQALTLLFMD